MKRKHITRRDFIRCGTFMVAGLVLYNVEAEAPVSAMPASDGFILKPFKKLGELQEGDGPALIEGATWYVSTSVGDGLEYRFDRGALVGTRYLTSDVLLDGRDLAVFFITLREGEQGPAFTVKYGLLNQCSARLRIPLSLMDMNRWRIDREGAWLKPSCRGQRVRLENVDRMTLTVARKSERPVRWCMTPIVATPREVSKLSKLILPKGPLIDELG